MKIKWTYVKPNELFSILYGILTVTVLAFSLLTLNSHLQDGQYETLFFLLVFIMLAISRSLLIVYYGFFERNNKIALYKTIGITIAYIVIFILIATLFSKYIYFFHIVLAIYLSTIAANRICLIFEKKRKLSTIYNLALLALLLFFVIVIYCSPETADESSYLMFLLFIIIVVSFAEVLGFAFSKIQLKGLLKIIRSTYIFEIIYGLLLLMIAFSFYFMIMEENIKTFADGLWYSFSIVTTIGLGDVYAKTPVGRVLSVILGIYGLIVVAAFTSVFVNFYRESTQNKRGKKIEKESEEDDDTKKDKKE